MLRKFATVRSGLAVVGLPKPAINDLEKLLDDGVGAATDLGPLTARIVILEAANTAKTAQIAALDARVTALEADHYTPIVAFEALTPGLWSTYEDSGTLRVRMANATDATRRCDCFGRTACDITDTAHAYFEGEMTVAGPLTGTVQFLDTTDGQMTATAPSADGNLVQQVGTRTSDTTLRFRPQPGTRL